MFDYSGSGGNQQAVFDPLEYHAADRSLRIERQDHRILPGGVDHTEFGNHFENPIVPVGNLIQDSRQTAFDRRHHHNRNLTGNTAEKFVRRTLRIHLNRGRHLRRKLVGLIDPAPDRAEINISDPGAERIARNAFEVVVQPDFFPVEKGQKRRRIFRSRSIQHRPVVEEVRQIAFRSVQNNRAGSGRLDPAEPDLVAEAADRTDNIVKGDGKTALGDHRRHRGPNPIEHEMNLRRHQRLVGHQIIGPAGIEPGGNPAGGGRSRLRTTAQHQRRDGQSGNITRTFHLEPPCVPRNVAYFS
ncbi:hypothetical protein SDC9_113471 [bioreactor metagenome]|uniref:Uncharacterized protein n=1 Tax=bioreactor metagenome TaxID=1076179 RepID=A0A645BPQ1_9ZZZZ